MVQAISSLLLRLLGWAIIEEYEELPPKYVLIAMPHTSNWDFPVGILARSALGLDVKFIGKDSLFRPPLGWLMRWMGGYPVDRSKSNNYVTAVAQLFDSKENFAICIAPEGTRSRVGRLRTGFYYIALEAGIPIIMGKFNWTSKQIILSPPFYPAGDKEADFAALLDYYKDASGKYPELGFV